MEYLSFNFGQLETEQQDMLTALLSEAGFSGFEDADDGFKAFASSSAFDANLFKQIIENFGIKYTESIIKERNWNAQWESGFEPVCVEHPETGAPWLRIRAGFHQPDPGYPLELEVTPKMSFGTGHHATTWLVAQQMALLDFRGRKVIDFGTGTGVLAILAEKLGASEVLAIDNDDWSISNAEENLSANAANRVRLMKADRLDGRTAADIVLANINLNVILENMQAISDGLLPGGMVLFSGLLTADQTTLEQSADKYSIDISGVFHRNGWIAAIGRKRVILSTK